MAEGANDTAGGNSSIGSGLGFRFSSPQLTRDDIHHVISRLRPLMEQAGHIGNHMATGGNQNIPLSTLLRHAPLRGHTHSHRHTHGRELPSMPSSDEFVINLDSSNGHEHQSGSNSGSQLNEQATTNNNNNTERQTTSPADILRESPELQAIFVVLEKYIPFILIMLAKAMYDHRSGILVFLGLLITFSHANSVLKREVARQSKRHCGALIAITINLIACIFFIYFVFSEDKLYLSIIFIPSYSAPLSVSELLWIVGVTDYILKLITIVFKVFILALPAKIIAFQKKGKYYLFLEQCSQLYRSLAPVQPWLYYLLEAYHGPGKIMGVFLSAAYIVSKGNDLMRKLKAWRLAFFKVLQSVSYGISPSRDQLDAAGGNCPICQDQLKVPTMLQCKHIFCEECVATWFDRERTCPMCRAQVVDDPTWRDGSTTHFIQLF